MALEEKKMALQESSIEISQDLHDSETRSQQSASTSLAIFSNLPNDVALECLARLCSRSRAIVSCVCRQWRDALYPHSIQPIRRTLSIAPEVWVFIMSYTITCHCLNSCDAYLKLFTHLHRYELLLVDPVNKHRKIIPSPLNFCRAEHEPIHSPFSPSTELDDMSSICTNQKIFLIGVRRFYCYSLGTESWRTLPLMSMPRTDFAYALLGKYLYVAGGCEDRLEYIYDGGKFRGTKHTRKYAGLRSAERFDIENNQWEEIAEMNHERCSALGFVVHDRFYVMGGRNDSIEFFNPETGSWTLLPNILMKPLLPNSCPPSVAVVKNKLYAKLSHSTQVLAYDIGGNIWEDLGSFDEHSDFSQTNLLGVGEEIWAIFPDSRIYSCRPGVKPPKWSQILRGRDNSQASEVISTSSLSMG
eukprot:Gb_31700 [translate_table: standard]